MGALSGGKKKDIWQIPGNPGQSLIQFCSCQVSHTHTKKPAKQQFQKVKTIESAKVVTVPLTKRHRECSVDGSQSAKVRLSPPQEGTPLHTHTHNSLRNIEHVAIRKKWSSLYMKEDFVREMERETKGDRKLFLENLLSEFCILCALLHVLLTRLLQLQGLRKVTVLSLSHV